MGFGRLMASLNSRGLTRAVHPVLWLLREKKRNNNTNVFIRTLRGLKIITTILLNHLMGHLCYSLANITLFFAKSLFRRRDRVLDPVPIGFFFGARAVLLAVALSLGVYIEEYLQSKYTVSMPEKISICLIRGRMESLDNDDVSIVYARKWEMGWFWDTYSTVTLQYSFALRVISDIPWSSCFESCGPKDTRWAQMKL